jgi:hypothetical protein
MGPSRDMSSTSPKSLGRAMPALQLLEISPSCLKGFWCVDILGCLSICHFLPSGAWRSMCSTLSPLPPAPSLLAPPVHPWSTPHSRRRSNDHCGKIPTHGKRAIELGPFNLFLIFSALFNLQQRVNDLDGSSLNVAKWAFRRRVLLYIELFPTICSTCL